MLRIVILAVSVAAASLATCSEATAAGRLSRFAALQQLSNPFGAFESSRYTTSSIGLPVVESSVESAPASTPPASAFLPEPETTTLTPASIMSSRTPYRPRVRSPFRPPPRPSLL